MLLWILNMLIWSSCLIFWRVRVETYVHSIQALGQVYVSGNSLRGLTLGIDWSFWGHWSRLCVISFLRVSEMRNQSLVHCDGHFGQDDHKVFVGIMSCLQPSCKMSFSVNRRWSSASWGMRRGALQTDTAGRTAVVLFPFWIWWSFAHIVRKLACFVSVNAYCHGHTKHALESNKE